MSAKTNADFGVFIGRFQPLHLGHEHTIRHALAHVARLIVLVGSANIARNPRNPFTYADRVEMIKSAFAYEISQGRVIVEPLNDHLYSDTAWVTEVQRRVNAIISDYGKRLNAKPDLKNVDIRDFKVALTGFGSDATSYYLKLFPEWDNIQIDSQYATFHAADIRARYFQRIPEVPTSTLSGGVAAWLDKFKTEEAFRDVLAETEYLAEYPKQWGKGPFVTADAVVIQSGHILLIKRGQWPGRGLLALPGGFVDPGERIRDASIRELREETGIADSKGQIPPAMLASFIEDARTQVFDAPNRSLRGRVITHAFLFRLPERRKLFKVRGGDDAAHAQWYRLGDLSPEMFFEDHWSIIEQMADL
jgi:bifunctional NMN adenylyltransferase/nudix hydrolase